MKCDTCGIESMDDLELEVWTCDECTVLTSAAWDAIEIARRIGVPRYGPSSWRDIPASEHLLHASNHIAASFKDNNEDHLSHAICRLAMAKALEDEI